MRISRPRPYIAEGLGFAFNPRRIAVVGASRSPHKVGFEVVKALLDRHYGGEILPVNPNAEEIQGLRAYKSVRAIPGEIDLVFIALPAAQTPQIVEDCAAKSVHAIAIASGGFRKPAETTSSLRWHTAAGPIALPCWGRTC
ncbi:MAG: CoA-binding protein [Ignavibacteriota bacterium]